uniref:Response regulator n=1 Tax=Desulfacinum infernum TaxID=35837 RepID=A0A832EKT6_9BACT
MNAGRKILVIDDDPEICQAMEAILGDNGYEVFTATDTVRGEAMLEEHKPDLLILDIMMATIQEGLDFAAKIKKKEGPYGLPIVIVSGRPATEKGYQRSVDEDMDWIAADIFMEKPVDPDDLLRNVRSLLTARKA